MSAVSELGESEVWYVSYGSNLCRDRLAAYLLGGRPAGARVSYPGARRRRLPLEDIALDLPGRLYFAGESSVWGGGVAFYDHDTRVADLPTAARGYRITVDQFADVAAQEMHRVPATGNPIEEVVLDGVGADGGLDGGRHHAGPGHYETLLDLGERDGLRLLTFTAPHGYGAVPQTPPSPAYRAMLGRGLIESRGWSAPQVEDYLAARSVA